MLYREWRQGAAAGHTVFGKRIGALAIRAKRDFLEESTDVIIRARAEVVGARDLDNALFYKVKKQKTHFCLSARSGESVTFLISTSALIGDASCALRLKLATTRNRFMEENEGRTGSDGARENDGIGLDADV